MDSLEQIVKEMREWAWALPAGNTQIAFEDFADRIAAFTVQENGSAPQTK